MEKQELLDMSDVDLEDKIKEVEDGIFSIFSSFEEYIYNSNLKIHYAIKESNFAKDTFLRLKKLINSKRLSDKYSGIFEDDVLKINVRELTPDISETDVLYIDFILPKLWIDYILGFKLWWENKTWNNFKCIFKSKLIFWVLTIESKEISDRDITDIFTIQTDDETFGKFDALKYTRQWLNKYFPNNGLYVVWDNQKENV